MKPLVFICALLSACFLLSGCGQPVAPIQPRAEGSKWLHKSYYREVGGMYSSGVAVESVLTQKQIGDKTCYQIQLITDWRSFWERLFGTVKLEPEDYTYFWEYMDERGSYHLDVDSRDVVPTVEDLKDFELTLPYPTEVGHTFKSDDGLETTTVIAVDQPITVPAGEFLCVVYESVYKDEAAIENATRDRLYMAPNVGLVRWEMDVLEDGAWVLDMRDDLVRYTPADER